MHVSIAPLRTEWPFAITQDYGRVPQQPDAPIDRQLTAKVKAALLAAGDITAREILIEATNGIVSLGGTVDSEAMRQATLTTVRMEPGVRDVVDQLVLRSALRDALARRKRKRRI
jgi:hypothetical protein